MISFEKLIEEWDYDRNEGNPQLNEYSYSKKVWWKCSFGHSYEMSIYNRINRHRGCPYCANQKLLTGFNDLQTVAPIIAAEWHPTKNGEVLLSQILGGGYRKVWWKCEKGHEWEAQIVSRVKQNVGCPYCSGRYAIQGENDLKTVGIKI